MMTSFHTGIGACRIAEVLNQRLGIEEKCHAFSSWKLAIKLHFQGKGIWWMNLKRMEKFPHIQAWVMSPNVFMTVDSSKVYSDV